MKKISTLIVILMLSVVLTACTKKQVEETNTAVTTQENIITNENEEETLMGSILDIAKKNVPMKCSATTKTEDGESEMTVYVSGNKIRNEVTVKTTSENLTYYMLSDGEYSYMWSSDSDQGTKMKFSELDENMNKSEEVEEVEVESAKYNDMNAEFDYKCSPWVPDNFKFDVPSDIEFVDFTSMLEGLTSEEGTIDTCSYCDSLPSQDAIDACKESLSC